MYLELRPARKLQYVLSSLAGHRASTQWEPHYSLFNFKKYSETPGATSRISRRAAMGSHRNPAAPFKGGQEGCHSAQKTTERSHTSSSEHRKDQILITFYTQWKIIAFQRYNDKLGVCTLGRLPINFLILNILNYGCSEGNSKIAIWMHSET